MDITTTFSDSLLRNGASPIDSFVFQIDALNGFLQEAYKINSHISELTRYLISIRASYLSLQPHRTARRKHHNALQDSTSSLPGADDSQPLTDTQRERIDVEMRQLLTTISQSIRQLSETSQTACNLDSSIATQRRERKGLGALGRWAAGSTMNTKSAAELEDQAAQETIKAHRDGVLWFLQRRLEGAGQMNRSMLEIRVNREVERSKSTLARAGASASAGSFNSGAGAFGGGMSGADVDREEQDRQRGVLEAMLSPEQLQLFEKEEQDMLKHYSDELNKIRTAESSLLEISSLQTQLAQNLEIQSENISQLVADSENTQENIDRGNKELKRASEKGSTAQRVFYATCVLCGILTVWDLVL